MKICSKIQVSKSRTTNKIFVAECDGALGHPDKFLSQGTTPEEAEVALASAVYLTYKFMYHGKMSSVRR